MKRIIVVLLISVFASACSGLEIGTKAWITRVDERQESQRTHRRAVPLKCYFTDCQAESQVEGS